MVGIDIAHQGNIPDCWLIATVNSLGHRRPDTLLGQITEQDGLVRVGDLTTTKHLPLPQPGPPGPLGRSPSGDTWVPLVERAVLEHRDGYDLAMGRPSEAFEAITGLASQTHYPAYMDPAQLTSTLSNPHSAVVASITKIEKGTPLDTLLESYGLYAGHSYSVAGVTADGRVVLSNPWGYNHPTPVPIDDFQRLFNHIDTWP